MGDLIRKSHNVSILMYYFVCVAKYRRLVITEEVDNVLKDTCIEISKRYEKRFLEIGTEGDHVHFLIQSLPRYSPTKKVTKVKSIIAREVFSTVPSVKEQLWGGEFWTDGYFVSTVGEYAMVRTGMIGVQFVWAVQRCPFRPRVACSCAEPEHPVRAPRWQDPRRCPASECQSHRLKAASCRAALHWHAADADTRPAVR